MTGPRMNTECSRRGRHHARGFTLVESVISIVIVAVMFAAVIHTVGAARMARYTTEGRQRGLLLAQQLIAEILQTSYLDPDDPPGPLGLDTGESASPRATYDDLDDYGGWFASPPQARDGTPLSGLAGWSREVDVQWADPTDLSNNSAVETGVKRITVTVKHQEVVMAELVTVRAHVLPDVIR